MPLITRHSAPWALLRCAAATRQIVPGQSQTYFIGLEVDLFSSRVSPASHLAQKRAQMYEENIKKKKRSPWLKLWATGECGESRHTVYCLSIYIYVVRS